MTDILQKSNRRVTVDKYQYDWNTAEMSNIESNSFVLRRAFWRGRVTRIDVEEAFKVSSATAGRWLQIACKHHAKYLERHPRWVTTRLQARAPKGALPEDFFEALSERKTTLRELGLYPQEVEIVYSSLCNTASPANDIAEALIKALIRKPIRALDISYVGLKQGESARWRTVVPVSLEVFHSQWRIHAHDLDDDGKLKTFVLDRVLEARRSEIKIPKGLVIQTGEQPRPKYKVTFNTLLTDDQRLVLRREMRLNDDNVVRLSGGQAFEFRRQYTDTEIKAQHSVPWPLVTRLELLET